MGLSPDVSPHPTLGLGCNTLSACCSQVTSVTNPHLLRVSVRPPQSHFAKRLQGSHSLHRDASRYLRATHVRATATSPGEQVSAGNT